MLEAPARSGTTLLFALMTKVGVYVLLRLSLLLFGDGAGPDSRHFGSDWLLWGGIATIVAGTIGMLGARDLGKLAGYNVVVSSGTLLGAVALQHPAVTAGALAYMVVSTLGIAALFMVAGLLAPEGEEEADDALQLEPYEPLGEEIRSDELYAEEDERRVIIPAPVAMLAVSFLACAVLLAGLPPLSGFLAKFAMLAPMLEAPAREGTLPLFALVIAAGFCTVVAMCRAGIHIFWADPDRRFPQARITEVSAIAMLLGLCLLLTVVVKAPMAYLEGTARQLHDPGNYVHGVLPVEGSGG
jgi:multicomponent K+:H+ antiporter subunit D